MLSPINSIVRVDFTARASMRIIRAFVAKPLELPFSRLFRRLFFAWLKCREIKQSQKIAAFGSSYIGMRSPRSCRRLRSFDLDLHKPGNENGQPKGQPLLSVVAVHSVMRVALVPPV